MAVAAKNSLDAVRRRIDRSPSSLGLRSSEANEILRRLGPNLIVRNEPSRYARVPFRNLALARVAVLLGMLLLGSSQASRSVLILSCIAALVAGLCVPVQPHQTWDPSRLTKPKSVDGVPVSVVRDGSWTYVTRDGLVPGDVVYLVKGDVVPADGRVLGCSAGFRVGDEARGAMGGKADVIERSTGDDAFDVNMLDTVLDGEAYVQVTKTGNYTLAGQAHCNQIESWDSAAKTSVYCQDMSRLCLNLLCIVALPTVAAVSFSWVATGDSYYGYVLLLVFLIVGQPLQLMKKINSILVSQANLMANEGGVVRRLTAIDDFAHLEVLCCDDVGFVRENKLRTGQPAFVGDSSAAEVLLTAALTLPTDRTELAKDIVDTAIWESVEQLGTLQALLSTVKYLEHSPLDSSRIVRTACEMQDKSRLECIKGATGAVFVKVSHENGIPRQTSLAYRKAIDQATARGYRCLGVAVKKDQGPWRLLGIVSFKFHVRPETPTAMIRAEALGLGIKVLTTDAVALAPSLAEDLGLRPQALHASQVDEAAQGRGNGQEEETAAHLLLKHDIISQVSASTMLNAVKALQKHGVAVAAAAHNSKGTETKTKTSPFPSPFSRHPGMAIATDGATSRDRAVADMYFIEPGLQPLIQCMTVARQTLYMATSATMHELAYSIHLLATLSISAVKFHQLPDPVLSFWLLYLNDLLPSVSPVNFPKHFLAVDRVRADMAAVRSQAVLVGLVLTGGSFLARNVVANLAFSGLHGFTEQARYLDCIVALHVVATAVWFRLASRCVSFLRWPSSGDSSWAKMIGVSSVTTYTCFLALGSLEHESGPLAASWVLLLTWILAGLSVCAAVAAVALLDFLCY